MEGWGLLPHTGGLGAQTARYCGERNGLEIIVKAFGPEHSMDKVKIEGVRSSWWRDQDKHLLFKSHQNNCDS